jgi:hypothetical protein
LIRDLLAFKVPALTLCVLIAASCGPRWRGFRVVPAAPNYLLHDPDSRQTPFPDVLRAYNGFEQGSAWVELRPDMELHIEDAYYEPGASRHGLAGFLGTEVAQYKVGPHGGLQLLSVRSMKDRPNDQPPVQELIPRSQQSHRYFRFYYEVLFRKSGNSRGSVLLSANAKNDINLLAAELMSDPDSVCGERSAHCTVFPEACSVSIEMEIVVNGSPRNVIWRSVLSDVMNQPHHLEFFRMYDGRLRPVKIDADDPKALKLPLLPGDHVKWN